MNDAIKKIEERRPAFSFTIREDGLSHVFIGLTKRELFAAMAMQGILTDKGYRCDYNFTAQVAINHADALLAELAKEEGA